MNQHTSEWSIEQLEILTREWNAGKSAGQIAAMIGKSRSAVCGKVNRMRLAGVEFVRAYVPTEVIRRIAAERRTYPKAPVRSPREVKLKLRPAREAPELPPPVDVTFARPWVERRAGECAFPISGDGADTLSCCAPCGETGYCAPHSKVMFKADPRKASDLVRLALREDR